MSDLFHKDVPLTFIQRAFDVMARCPQYQFQILTKRAARLRQVVCPWSPWLPPIDALPLDGIHWVIVGGESGPDARPMNPEWVDSILRQCRARGVAFFFKQWGGVRKDRTGRVLRGRTYDEMPANAMVHPSEPLIAVLEN